MTLLIIGGGGMLGHRVVTEARRAGQEVVWTTRGDGPGVAGRVLGAEGCATGVDLDRPETVQGVLDDTRPAVVLNCAGLVKQRPEAAGAVAAIRANALAPHHLALACERTGARLLHVSTDCVFSGGGHRPAGYTEDDAPDPVDLYGRSKLLGEVTQAPHLTLRTSMIGRELERTSGLLEWFLGAAEPVSGFMGARFSGPTAHEVARTLVGLATMDDPPTGLWHLGASPITKYDLVLLLRDAFRPGLPIQEAAGPSIDRALDGSRLAARLGQAPPSWEAMVAELAADPIPYGALREGGP
ncbi:MAG: SDR family oxidoreductase [Miltoncostaeaceae bacterium]